MNERRSFILLPTILLILFLSGCAGAESPSPTPTETTQTTGAVFPTETVSSPAETDENAAVEVPTATSVPTVTVEPTATTEPTATAPALSYAINGRIWHDICTGVLGDDGEPPAGCVTTEDGAALADGLLEDEPGIAGVLLHLGSGSCPSTEEIITATTDADGTFNIVNLTAAEYCLSVDANDEQNQDILLPGRWTSPIADVAEVSVSLSEEEAVQEVNFGWDYELLPADLTDCSNSFEFVEDLSIPDDTIFAPGEEFVKSWQLRNNGTCPWSTDYTIVFVSGELMAAEESFPLADSVALSETLDVSIPMIAPLEAGTYRGNWQLADPNGEPFGIDGNAEDAFWLRIIVEEEAVPGPTPLPNSGAIGGVVWDDYCINSSPGRGCVESGAGSGISVANGSYEAFEIGLSEITISLAENACPGDGLLPPETAVIDTVLTDEDGIYLFENLSEGTYCIFMDALSTENVDFLIPGNWTWPGTGVGKYTFILDPGEQALDLDFGWDFVD